MQENLPTELAQIAQWLINHCSCKHKNGTPYLDDYLDTWAFVFSVDNPFTWEEVEQEIERLKNA